MTHRIEGLSNRFGELFAQSDELTTKQLALEGLYDKLAEVDGLARKATSQLDSLRQGRQDLEVLRRDVLEFHSLHAEITQLTAGLATDRQTLHALNERTSAISASTADLEAKLDAIVTQMSLAEKASQQAGSLKEFMSTLDGQVARLESRASIVKNIELRLNSLYALNVEVDRRLVQQLEARSEFDLLKTTSAGVLAQIADAQHKLEALNELQARFLPLFDQVQALRAEIDATRSHLDAIAPDEAAVAEQERRFAELMATSGVLAGDLADHKQKMQALAAELVRSDNIKETLARELDLLQTRERDTRDHIAACEEQLARAERMFHQLEERRVQIALAEKKLATVEGRLAEITQIAHELDTKQETIQSRGQLVMAVKAQVDAVHLIGARSKADLDYVLQQRGDVAALKAQLDELSLGVADTNQRVASIDARRKLIEEVESKASAILELLDDVRINVETIGEQKAVVDEVARTAAQLEFRLQEARSALASLQHEREQAERLEQGIKQLSLKTVRAEELRAPAEG